MRAVSNRYTTVLPSVREMIHLLKLMDYLLIHGDKQRYNFTSLFLPEFGLGFRVKDPS